MRGVKDSMIRMSLDALYFSGVYQLMAPATEGRGVIFMLHRVRKTQPGAFAPNRGLEIGQDFLDGVLTRLKQRDIDIVDLDEAVARLRAPSGRRFAALTFDDGYADNIDAALPVFEAHNAPFTIYVTTGLIDGTADIWWLELEEALARLSHLTVRIGERAFDMKLGTVTEKQAAWDALYWPVRDLAAAERSAWVTGLMREAGIETGDIFASIAPSWERLRRAAQHPLVRIGAHTITHPALSRMPLEAARREIVGGRDILESKIGRKVANFAYPFGDPASAGPREYALAAELGFVSAVTTSPGPLFGEHALQLHALPRVSLNGNYQSMRYVDVFLSGAPFALFNRVKKRAA